MPPLALGLVLLSTVTHAAWNGWVKASAAKLAYLWLGLAAAIVIYAVPVGALYPLAVPAPVWPILLGSAVCETGYMVAITRAYGLGDLSLVYPISRGSAPLFIALWAALFLGERLPLAGYAGIALLTAGIYLVSLPQWADLLQPLRALRGAGARWALLSGVFIAGYTTLDKAGVARMAPPAYSLWTFIAMTVVSAPAVLRLEGWRGLTDTLRGGWGRVVRGGLFVMGTYFLVLWALAQAPASYVGAARGMSVLLGTAWGARVLGERFGPGRIVGAGLMFVGLVTLALGG